MLNCNRSVMMNIEINHLASGAWAAAAMVAVAAYLTGSDRWAAVAAFNAAAASLGFYIASRSSRA